MRACEDFELEKVNKDSDKVDDRVDGDHDGHSDQAYDARCAHLEVEIHDAYDELDDVLPRVMK